MTPEEIKKMNESWKNFQGENMTDETLRKANQLKRNIGPRKFSFIL